MVKNDEQILEDLAALPPRAYERVRKQKAIDLNLGVGPLDRIVKDICNQKSSTAESIVDEIEPYEHEINIVEVFKVLTS